MGDGTARNDRNNRGRVNIEYNDESVESLKKLEAKETIEEYMMNRQFLQSKAALEEAFASYRREQYQRRKRYMQRNGIEDTIQHGYNIPFWSWWMNQLISSSEGHEQRFNSGSQNLQVNGNAVVNSHSQNIE